jgi:hypothetical protein
VAQDHPRRVIAKLTRTAPCGGRVGIASFQPPPGHNLVHSLPDMAGHQSLRQAGGRI